MKFASRSGRVIAVFGAGLMVLAGRARGAPADRIVLPGHVPAQAAILQPTGRLPGTNRLNLAIGLPLRHQDQLSNLLDQLYDPASPNYRHYLAPRQFEDQFCPTEQDYQTALAFAATNGFTITGTHSDRMVLDVNAAAADIERAFQIKLQVAPHPTEARDFYAPDTEPSVAAGVPIADVSGLNNFTLPHPKNLRRWPAKLTAQEAPHNGSGTNGLLAGNDFRAAYVPGVSLTGAGQMLGLFEFDGYHNSDITTYEDEAGLPHVPLQNVLIDNFSGHAGGGNSEVALDIEMAVAMAPGLSKVVVYEAGPNGFANDILSSMTGTNTMLVQQFSCSWDFGTTPRTTMDGYFMRFAAQGQSFFDASGDSGAYSGGIPQPDDDPYTTQVGGTSLSTVAPGGAWLGETAWNAQDGFDATGGGISTTYSLPTWQQGVATTANGGSTTKRNVPDVAMVSESVYIVADGGMPEGTGGTSVASPLWAGFNALVNQQLAATGKPRIGFINPAIYALGKSAGYAATFDDITFGNNTNSGVGAKKFLAVSGYDLCTGWGTPIGGNLLQALTAPDNLLITPGRGFIGSGPPGGPFTVTTQTLRLTNSGAASLNWSAGSPPSWLDLAPTSGTLAPGSTGSITATLDASASGLGLGVYTADLWMTNLTSGIAQLRQFTVRAGQDVVRDGGFETGDFAYWTLTGIGAASNNFPDDGTVITEASAHSGGWFAALGQVGNLAYLSQPLPTRAGQLYRLSFWLENLAAGDTPNRFLVQWNTNTAATNIVYSKTNLAVFAWTNIQFTVAATTNQTLLQFGFRNDQDYLFLDDVSVLPIPAPSIQSVTPGGNGVQLVWNALPGLNYQVEYKTNLTQAHWVNLGAVVMATTNTASAAEFTGPDPQQFYRVQWVP